MKKRRAVLDVNTGSLFRDMNSSSVTASRMSKSSNLKREDDCVTNITMVDPYSSISEIDQTPRSTVCGGHSYSPWQMCTDDTSGYTYYWNMETNQVTWEIPPEYSTHETAFQQYQLAQNNSTTNEIHPLIKHKIARTTQEVIANRNSASKKTNVEGKSIQLEDNDQVGLVPYGPTWEDDGKMASARKRLLSYKSDKLKPKSDELNHVSMYSETTCTSVTPSVPTTCFPPKGEAAPCKIPFVPTPDEMKEHPIFSKFTLPQNSVRTNETQASRVLTPRSAESTKSSLVAEHYRSEGEDSEDNEDEHSDDIIITRLRKKALMLKELGGDVPKEIISVLDDTKTAQDIIAEIEKEIPPDANDDDSLMEMDIDTDEEADQPCENSASKSISPGLESVSGTGYIVELKSSSSRSLPTTRKSRLKNIQKIKLSARARELIKTSLLTAKARATNFVETVDGLKPAEEVLGGGERKKENEEATRSSLNSEETSSIDKIESTRDSLDTSEDRRKREEMQRFKSDVEISLSSTVKRAAASAAAAEPCPIAASFGFATKSPHPDYVSPSANVSFPPPPPADAERRICSLTEADEGAFVNDSLPKPPNQRESASSKSDLSDKKTRGDMFSFQSSFVVPNVKRVKGGGTAAAAAAAAADETEAMKISLVSKCDEFLQSVKKSVESETRKKPTLIREEEKNATKQIVGGDVNNVDEVLNSKEDEDRNVVDFSQLIMEKLKFLNDGKSSVTPVQVMAIQIETLIGAWQVKALTTKYLQDWLTISSVHLKDIEEAAAPSGWQCEWDRSYGRYYYRNKRTGTIQWEFPETDRVTVAAAAATPLPTKKRRSEEESSKNKRPKTPPPPTISKTIVPPPPPVISDLDTTRYQKFVHHSDRTAVTFDHQTRSPPLSTAPPLPTSPLRPATPPPPPPLPLSPQSCESAAAPPPPPPPPPSPPAVISESRFLPDDSTFVTSKLRSSSSTDKSSSGLHDELSSFYSDIASLEATFSQVTDKIEEEPVKTSLSNASERARPAEMTVFATKVEEKAVKKKKKVKLDSALSLKKKGLEGLVAKWQKVNADI